MECLLARVKQDAAEAGEGGEDAVTRDIALYALEVCSALIMSPPTILCRTYWADTARLRTPRSAP